MVIGQQNSNNKHWECFQNNRPDEAEAGLDSNPMLNTRNESQSSSGYGSSKDQGLTGEQSTDSSELLPKYYVSPPSQSVQSSGHCEDGVNMDGEEELLLKNSDDLGLNSNSTHPGSDCVVDHHNKIQESDESEEELREQQRSTGIVCETDRPLRGQCILNEDSESQGSDLNDKLDFEEMLEEDLDVSVYSYKTDDETKSLSGYTRDLGTLGMEETDSDESVSGYFENIDDYESSPKKVVLQLVETDDSYYVQNVKGTSSANHTCSSSGGKMENTSVSGKQYHNSVTKVGKDSLIQPLKTASDLT